MAKDYTEMKRLIAKTEIVIGTFSEHGKKRTRIIKGKRLLERIRNTNANDEGAKALYLPCDNAEEAEAYRMVVGDGRLN